MRLYRLCDIVSKLVSFYHELILTSKLRYMWPCLQAQQAGISYLIHIRIHAFALGLRNGMLSTHKHYTQQSRCVVSVQLWEQAEVGLLLPSWSAAASLQSWCQSACVSALKCRFCLVSLTGSFLWHCGFVVLKLGKNIYH